jgi:hypothetical protein
MQKFLSSRHEFSNVLVSAVFGNSTDCKEIVDKCVDELEAYTGRNTSSFYLEINNALISIGVRASSIKAEGIEEYNKIIKKAISTIGVLFDKSAKDEKVAEALTFALRYWQVKEIEDVLRHYREMTYKRNDD